MKQLTRRQQEFLSKFLDLYNKERVLLHYTDLAEYVGVNKISAYEMLRLLEKRGLVEAEYLLPANQRGPGRASVMFRPTNLATQVLTRLAGGSADQKEWETVKEHILQQLEAGRSEKYKSFVEELLIRASDQASPLIYAAEMITTIILGLESLTDSTEAHRLRDELMRKSKIGELRLSIFTGLGMGLTVAERVNRRLAGFLLVQSSRFQSVLSQLSDDSRLQLADFTQEVMQKVGA